MTHFRYGFKCSYQLWSFKALLRQANFFKSHASSLLYKKSKEVLNFEEFNGTNPSHFGTVLMGWICTIMENWFRRIFFLSFKILHHRRGFTKKLLKYDIIFLLYISSSLFDKSIVKWIQSKWSLSREKKIEVESYKKSKKF